MSLLGGLEALARINRVLFVLAAVCCVLMSLLAAAIVIARYGFSFGSIAAQELVMYLHAYVLLAASATTLALDEHVRVDIFYRGWSLRRRALVDLLGHLLLALPVLLFVAWMSWDYVAQAWLRRETSSEAGGLPWVYGLKSLILLFAAQMTLQCLVQAVQAWLQWRKPGGSEQ